MYLGKQGENVICISENKEELEAIQEVAGLSSIDETDDIVEKVGVYYLVGADAITEGRRQQRADAYRKEKDPITCQIDSLRDEEQTPEVIEEINELLQKRADVVRAIRELYPYPAEEQD